jgi:hypothetical protein
VRPRKRTLVGASDVGGNGLPDTAIIPLLPDAVLPRQHLKAVLVQ